MYDFRFNNLCRLDGHLKHRDILVGIAGSKVTRSKFAKIITIHGERMIDLFESLNFKITTIRSYLRSN
jgi:hypothetical protein